MNFLVVNFVVTGLLFFGILGSIWLGTHAARRRKTTEPEGAATTTAVDGAVYALLGLLIAFTFSGATERFAGRRAMIVEEANAIGTAYYRVDLLPDAEQPAMRDRFRGYLGARLEAYGEVPDMPAVEAALARSVSIQNEMWAKAEAAAATMSNTACAMLLLPALNSMFDIASTRLAASEHHPPATIFGMLIAVALVSGLLFGHATGRGKHRPVLHSVVYAAVIATSYFVILDIEYPRQGLIRVDEADQILRAVLESMK